MPRERFEREMQQLLDQVLILGSMVERAMVEAMEALKRQDHITAQRIYEHDQRINEKRYDLENTCITVIATQQPMARDVRFLTAILEIITELERIGDYAKGISKINILMGDTAVEPMIMVDLQEMATLGLGMLKRALDAFIDNNPETALGIADEDDQVDQLFAEVYRKVMALSRANPEDIEHFNHLMWAAHNLERMADRVTNICERIVYVATGEIKELDQSEGFYLGG